MDKTTPIAPELIADVVMALYRWTSAFRVVALDGGTVTEADRESEYQRWKIVTLLLGVPIPRESDLAAEEAGEKLAHDPEFQEAAREMASIPRDAQSAAAAGKFYRSDARVLEAMTKLIPFDCFVEPGTNRLRDAIEAQAELVRRAEYHDADRPAITCPSCHKPEGHEPGCIRDPKTPGSPISVSDGVFRYGPDAPVRPRNDDRHSGRHGGTPGIEGPPQRRLEPNGAWCEVCRQVHYHAENRVANRNADPSRCGHGVPIAQRCWLCAEVHKQHVASRIAPR